MLRVTAEASRSALDAWVSEQVDETVVITSGEELTVRGTNNGVDVSAISARGVDTLGLPLELAGLACPSSARGVAAARGVLLAVGDCEEKQLVGAAVGAEVVGLRAPVKGHDVGAVAAAGADQAEALGAVDADLVVVRADREVLVVRGEGHHLDPLPALAQEVHLLVGVGAGADRHFAVVASHGEEVGVDRDAARALRVGQAGKRRGAASLDLLLAVGDLAGALKPALRGVPHHDLVVVAGGHNAAVGHLGKTPDLAVGVRAHDVGLVSAGVDAGDGAVALANEDVAGGVDVDGADDVSVAELDGLLDLLAGGVDAADSAVLAARPELAVDVLQGADEVFALGDLDGALAGAVVVPVVDLAVGAA